MSKKENNLYQEENEMDWVWIYVANGMPCLCCGKIEYPFPNYICDAHTNGMDKYGHLEFQIVIDFGPQIVGKLLNIMGYRVKNGERFKDGDVLKDFFPCDVFLKEVSNGYGKRVLRLIIPDTKGRLPEHADRPYCLQMLDTPLLYELKNKNTKE